MLPRLERVGHTTVSTEIVPPNYTKPTQGKIVDQTFYTADWRKKRVMLRATTIASTTNTSFGMKSATIWML